MKKGIVFSNFVCIRRLEEIVSPNVENQYIYVQFCDFVFKED